MNKDTFLKEEATLKNKIDKKCCLNERRVISKEFFCNFEHKPPKSVFVTYALTYGEDSARVHSDCQRKITIPQTS